MIRFISLIVIPTLTASYAAILIRWSWILTKETDCEGPLYARPLQEISISCSLICNISCDMLTITDFKSTKDKKGIFLTSRVHPGESMTSYIIEYIIDFLLGNSFEAKMLRENFIFKIVPMLNIDGVINGNYRVNLAGYDLNRQ